MSNFQIGARLEIKEIWQKPKTVITKVHEIGTYNYEEKMTGSITVPKEVIGEIKGILERNGVNRKETEYIVRVWDPNGDVNKSITKNYAESYLIRYGRLLT